MRPLYKIELINFNSKNFYSIFQAAAWILEYIQFQNFYHK